MIETKKDWLFVCCLVSIMSLALGWGLTKCAPARVSCPDCVCNYNVSLGNGIDLCNCSQEFCGFCEKHCKPYEPCELCDVFNITWENFWNVTPPKYELMPWIINETSQALQNKTGCKPKPYNCTLVSPDDADLCCENYCLGETFNRIIQECE